MMLFRNAKRHFQKAFNRLCDSMARFCTYFQHFWPKSRGLLHLAV